jgi:hypothetical protein
MVLKFPNPISKQCVWMMKMEKKWQEATEAKLASIDEYSVFIDQGHHTKAKTPTSYKKNRVHLIFDVKHDGRHKSRLVADGHLTDVPLESVY